MTTKEIPPLKGDGNGFYRVNIVGNSGSGKSTLARELSEILNVPAIHMDKVFWKPNWTESDREEFRNRLIGMLDSQECARGWVVDGNYSRRAGDIVGSRATDVIWLDPPFLLYFPRLVKRTFLRLLGIGPPCAPGCHETVSNVFFTRDSIILWGITHHLPVKKNMSDVLRTNSIEMGGNMRRIGGWGRELMKWKESVVEMIKRR